MLYLETGSNSAAVNPRIFIASKVRGLLSLDAIPWHYLSSSKLMAIMLKS